MKSMIIVACGGNHLIFIEGHDNIHGLRHSLRALYGWANEMTTDVAWYRHWWVANITTLYRLVHTHTCNGFISVHGINKLYTMNY